MVKKFAKLLNGGPMGNNANFLLSNQCIKILRHTMRFCSGSRNAKSCTRISGEENRPYGILS